MNDCLEKLTICLEPLVLVKIKEFLIGSIDQETREYEEENEQIEQILVRENYLSRRDIFNGISKFEINTLKERIQYEKINLLFNRLKKKYSDE